MGRGGGSSRMFMAHDTQGQKSGLFSQWTTRQRRLALVTQLVGPFTLSHAGSQPVTRRDTWASSLPRPALVPKLPFFPCGKSGRNVDVLKPA